MEYKVQLQFFQDDTTGDYGLAHKNSIDNGFDTLRPETWYSEDTP